MTRALGRRIIQGRGEFVAPRKHSQGCRDEKDIREILREQKRTEKTGKYKPLSRNRQTGSDALRIFEQGD
jgi:hypothetical protein